MRGWGGAILDDGGWVMVVGGGRRRRRHKQQHRYRIAHTEDARHKRAATQRPNRFGSEARSNAACQQRTTAADGTELRFCRRRVGCMAAGLSRTAAAAAAAAATADPRFDSRGEDGPCLVRGRTGRRAEPRVCGMCVGGAAVAEGRCRAPSDGVFVAGASNAKAPSNNAKPWDGERALSECEPRQPLALQRAACETPSELAPRHPRIAARRCPSACLCMPLHAAAYLCAPPHTSSRARAAAGAAVWRTGAQQRGHRGFRGLADGRVAFPPKFAAAM